MNNMIDDSVFIPIYNLTTVLSNLSSTGLL